jgi:hypothetical protein
MFDGVREFTAAMQGDSTEFMEKVQALVIGVARDYLPARLYVIRIDNWFGPKWMHFAGKFTAGKTKVIGVAAIGVHKRILHVPPFVPHRVIAKRVFQGPEYGKSVTRPPLHIECTSEFALTRRIADVDKEAAFVWFSSESETQKRGSIMVYLPAVSAPPASRRRERRTGALYVGLSEHEMGWEPAMLRGISRGELAHLEANGKTSTDNPVVRIS